MRVLIAIVSAASLVLAACSSGAVPAGASAGERTITVEMRDFGYSPSTIKLAPGERVTLIVKNAGTVEHEFKADAARYRPATHGAHVFDMLPYLAGDLDRINARSASPGGGFAGHGPGARASRGTLATLQDHATDPVRGTAGAASAWV